uniref:Uncharacterized protein n=1 Tax=Avena sativa TaxID=4498 RepID=A0ACD5Z031_AVESA
MTSKLLALVLVMAIAGLVSAEGRAALLRGTAPSSVGAVESPWQHRVLRRGDKMANGLAWRWRRDPPSGPSRRGQAVVDVAPEEEEKKQTNAENIDPSLP